MKRHIYIITFCLLFAFSLHAAPAFAGDTPYIGQMIWVPYNVVPKGWARCDGQLFAISQNQALFSLLGTYFGGNGTSNFAVPDMQGKVLINSGWRGDLSTYYTNGDTGGEETHTLTVEEMPQHTHYVQASSSNGTDTSPQNNYYAQSQSGKFYGSNPSALMSSLSVGVTGGGQPYNNMMPYTTLNCLISLQGAFPPRPW